MIFTMNKQILSLCVLAIAGCGSESGTTSTPEPTPEAAHMLPIDMGDPVDKFIDPIIEPTPEEPEKPVAPPEPQQPTLPIFIGDGITTHTQQPYSGTIVKGGDAYLRYNQDATTMDKFELPEWTVEYRYQPFLEVLITNGGETLCARYSWKKGGFGYAKPVCLWSDTRQALPLEDMQAAYYGYSVVETRVWVSGVVGLEVEIK